MAQVEVKWVFPGAKEAAEAIKAIEGSIKRTGEQAKESAGKTKEAFDLNLKSLAALAIGYAGVTSAADLLKDAVAGVRDFIKDSVAAAVESQKETAQLARQVEAAGVSWNKYGGIIDDAVQSASKYARVQDEEVSAALRQMILITDDVRESTKNLNLAVDLSYAKNISLSQAAEMVGRAMEGDIRSLGQFLPELKNLDETLGANATSSQKAEAALRVLHQRVDGATQSMPEFEKQTKDLSLAWEDFKEKVGTKILPVASQLLTWINESVDALQRQAVQLQTSTSWWEKFYIVASNIPILDGIVTGINDLVEGAHKLSAEIDAISGTDSKGFGLLNYHMKEGAKGIKEFKAGLDAIPDSARKAAEEAVKAAQQIQLGFKIQTEAVGQYQERLGEKIKQVYVNAWGDFQEYQGKKILAEARGTAQGIAESEEMKGRIYRDHAQENYNVMVDKQKDMQREFEHIWRSINAGIGDAFAGAAIYGENFWTNIQDLGKNIAANFISSIVQAGIEAATQAAGIKASLQAIFSTPIYQPIVPVTDPTGTGAAAASGAGAGGAGVGGAGAGAGAGLPVAASVAAGIYSFNTGLHADTTEERITAMAINPVTGGAGLIANQFGHELTLNQRLNRAYGQSAVDAARNAVTDRVWDRLSGDQKAGLIEFMNSHGGLTPDQVASNPIYQQASTLKEQIDRTADQASRDSLQKQLSDLLANVSPTDRRNLGLAKGGIVTREGWFNLGEMGKKEAVIPLENPQAMQHLAGFGGRTIEVHNHFHGPTAFDEITWAKMSKRMMEQFRREMGRYPNG